MYREINALLFYQLTFHIYKTGVCMLNLMKKLINFKLVNCLKEYSSGTALPDMLLVTVMPFLSFSIGRMHGLYVKQRNKKMTFQLIIFQTDMHALLYTLDYFSQFQ